MRAQGANKVSSQELNSQRARCYHCISSGKCNIQVHTRIRNISVPKFGKSTRIWVQNCTQIREHNFQYLLGCGVLRSDGFLLARLVVKSVIKNLAWSKKNPSCQTYSVSVQIYFVALFCQNYQISLSKG